MPPHDYVVRKLWEMRERERETRARLEGCGRKRTLPAAVRMWYNRIMKGERPWT